MICNHCGKPVTYNITEEQKKEVIGFHKEGYSLRDIQTLTGVSFSSVRRIVLTRKDAPKPRKK